MQEHTPPDVVPDFEQLAILARDGIHYSYKSALSTVIHSLRKNWEWSIQIGHIANPDFDKWLEAYDQLLEREITNLKKERDGLIAAQHQFSPKTLRALNEVTQKHLGKAAPMPTPDEVFMEEQRDVACSSRSFPVICR